MKHIDPLPSFPPKQSRDSNMLISQMLPPHPRTQLLIPQTDKIWSTVTFQPPRLRKQPRFGDVQGDPNISK